MAASAAAAAAAGELKEKIEALRDNVHHMHNQFQTAWTNRHFEFDESKFPSSMDTRPSPVFLYPKYSL